MCFSYYLIFKEMCRLLFVLGSKHCINSTSLGKPSLTTTNLDPVVFSSTHSHFVLRPINEDTVPYSSEPSVV